MKISVYTILISLVLIMSALVIGLRGTSSQPNVYQTDTLQNVTSIHGISLGERLWADNLSRGEAWPLNVPNTATANLLLNGTLTLSVGFSNQANAQAVSISHNVDLSLDRNPIIIAQVTVSPGAHYGVRFSGLTPTGATFNAWSESSDLQHRPGLGTPENISANLQSQAYLANEQIPPPGSRITQISFYVEATPGTQAQYFMRITSLQAFVQEQVASTHSEISGSFLDVVMSLNLPPTDLSLFQTFVSFDIRGTSNLQYIPFLVNGTNVLAQGFTYAQISATTHENAVLNPQLVATYPSILSPNSTEIIISAKSGEINYFKLDDLSFKYTSTPLQTQGLVDPNLADFLTGYYILFLFVTPIVAVILISKVFKSED